MVQYWLHAAEVRYRFNARQFGGSIGATISKETAVLLHLAGKVAHAVFGQFPRRALALVLEWRERRPKLDPARFTALRIVDDASYCFGVWLGCIRERTVAPLRPQFVNWPGRRKVSEDS